MCVCVCVCDFVFLPMCVFTLRDMLGFVVVEFNLDMEVVGQGPLSAFCSLLGMSALPRVPHCTGRYMENLDASGL